jgi:hypothetical protein
MGRQRSMRKATHDLEHVCCVVPLLESGEHDAGEEVVSDVVEIGEVIMLEEEA